MESYVQHLVSIAVSQICLVAGWQSIQRSSLDTLADVALKYIEEIGNASASFAHLTGRTEVNYVDVKGALDELGVSLPKLIEYHDVSGQLPFAKALPAFPIEKPATLCHPTFNMFPVTPEMCIEEKENSSKKPSRPSYVPSFLPAFPDKRTYLSTPVFVGQERDRKTTRKKKVQENILIEKSLTKLHRASSMQIYPGMVAGQSMDSMDDKPIGPVNYQIEQSRLDPFSNRTYLWGKTEGNKNIPKPKKNTSQAERRR